MGLTIWGEVFDDLLRRDSGPSVMKPSVPDIFWISVVARLHHEFGFHQVRRSAAVKRFGVVLPVRVQMVVWPLETLKPLLMQPLRPIAMT
jgi:hypothetical protein